MNGRTQGDVWKGQVWRDEDSAVIQGVLNVHYRISNVYLDIANITFHR